MLRVGDRDAQPRPSRRKRTEVPNSTPRPCARRHGPLCSRAATITRSGWGSSPTGSRLPPGARGRIASSQARSRRCSAPTATTPSPWGSGTSRPVRRQAGRSVRAVAHATGFDRFLRLPRRCTSQWEPVLCEDNHPVAFPIATATTSREDLIDDRSRSSRISSAPVAKPFLLYLCLGAAHSPHHSPQALRRQVRTRLREGMGSDAHRQTCPPEAMGLVPQHTELPPRNPGVRPWDELSDDERRPGGSAPGRIRRMIDHADDTSGASSTISTPSVSLTTPSSSSSPTTGQPGRHADRDHPSGRAFESVQRASSESCARRRDRTATVAEQLPPRLGAMASNTPLKWYKQNTHGGGIRDPLTSTGHRDSRQRYVAAFATSSTTSATSPPPCSRSSASRTGDGQWGGPATDRGDIARLHVVRRRSERPRRASTRSTSRCSAIEGLVHQAESRVPT